MYRCAEPEPTLNIEGSPDDQFYLSIMARVEGSETPETNMLHIFSARPDIVKKGSKEPTVAKHGFESSHY
jgi:hypothetical protein